MRTATVARDTKETSVTVTVALDGSGRSRVATGIGFFDHMLDQLARHSLIDLEVATRGDLHIDDHHAVEDTGTMDTELFEEFFRAFAFNALITLHVTRRAGRNAHHVAEACFKAVARALGAALAVDPRQNGAIPSTKGVL